MSANPQTASGRHPSAEEKTIEALEKTATFWKSHYGPVLLRAGLAILVLVLILAMVAGHRQRQQARLAEGYRVLKDAETADAMLEVAKNFHGTPPGAMASLKAAQKFFDDNLFERAQNQFSLFLQEYPGHALRGNAILGEACALEGLGKFAEAENRFAVAAETLGDEVIRARAYLSAGRCAEAGGRPDNAKKWYEMCLGVKGADPACKDMATAAIKRLAAAPATK